MKVSKRKIIISIILVLSVYRLITLLFSTYPLGYKMLLILGISNFIFFVLTLSSCYNFRRLSARTFYQICNIEKSCSRCRPEGFLEKHHRGFYWVTFILTPLHLFFAFRFGFVSLAAPVFSSIAILFGIFYFLWLLSCHYFKYFFKERVLVIHPKSLMGRFLFGVYRRLTKFYLYHNIFFWLALIFLLLHLITILLARI